MEAIFDSLATIRQQEFHAGPWPAQHHYPWRDSLKAWAADINIKIDVGLVTMLGAEEMDLSIGRLMSSPYLEFLPLLGAFVIARDGFTEKCPGFTQYAVSGRVMTTEIAGWFYLWIRSQEFETVRTKIAFEVKRRPTRWTPFLIGCFLVSLPLNGMLIAMTIFSGD